MVLKKFGAALCTASDIPATRKLGGFVGHGSVEGCSRCLKCFSTSHFGQHPDYSGFDSSSWPKRVQGKNWKLATTLKKREDIEQCYGFRYTELLRLPYFDSVRLLLWIQCTNFFLAVQNILQTCGKKMELSVILITIRFNLLLTVS